jgi:hypothetical protein
VKRPNKTTEANAGGPPRLRMRTRSAARIVQFYGLVNSLIAYRILLVILVASLQACAPASKTTAPRKVQVISAISPKLTASEALAIADASLKNWDDNLRHYPGRKAEYSKDKDEWSIYYWREPNRWPGDHFTVYVHDKTGTTRVRGGL